MATSVEIIGQSEYTGWLGFKRRYVYPFRWFYQSHIWGFSSRVRNCIMFASAIWHWDWIDSGCTLEIMEIAFRYMSKMQAKHGHLVSSDKTSRQTLIVAELCRRLHDDGYFELARNELNSRGGQRWAKHVDYLGKQDSEYLGKMFRFVQHWWN